MTDRELRLATAHMVFETKQEIPKLDNRLKRVETRQETHELDILDLKKAFLERNTPRRSWFDWANAEAREAGTHEPVSIRVRDTYSDTGRHVILPVEDRQKELSHTGTLEKRLFAAQRTLKRFRFLLGMFAGLLTMGGSIITWLLSLRSSGK
jgi:hypothetical protein